MSSYVYVLQLSHHKWYVGHTTQPLDRFLQHWSEEGGCAWTAAFPPQQVHELRVAQSKFEEDALTLRYMELHGLDNVRGGSYSQMILSPADRREIQRRLDTANGVCTLCHRPGHFARECGDEAAWDAACLQVLDGVEQNRPSPANNAAGAKRARLCTRCGRNSHFVDTCKARTHLNGAPLDAAAASPRAAPVAALHSPPPHLAAVEVVRGTPAKRVRLVQQHQRRRNNHSNSSSIRRSSSVPVVEVVYVEDGGRTRGGFDDDDEYDDYDDDDDDDDEGFDFVGNGVYEYEDDDDFYRYRDDRRYYDDRYDDDDD